MTVFVPNGEGQGLTATWLLYTADENGIDRRSIKTTKGGFNVPDELAACLTGQASVPAPPLDAAETEMPEVGSRFVPELPDSHVVTGDDGKVYLTDEGLLAALADGTVIVETDPAFTELIAEVATARESELNSADFNDEPVVDREVIREWAKEQGLNPAAKGALKKSVLDAYAQAHS